jgi:hypothetical protein
LETTTAANIVVKIPMDEGDAEALHRTGAEEDHDDRGDEGRQVAVDNGRPGLVETGLEGGGQRLAELQLLAHALEDEDVRVDGHRERQHDARDAGQREGGSVVGHDREDDEDVDAHADRGDHAADGVEEQDEGDCEARADDEGELAGGDGVVGQGGTDLILLLDGERQIERVVEHVGEVDGLALGEGPGDFRAATVDLLAHGRRGVELVVEHDGKAAQAAGALALVGDGLGDVGELPAARVGEFEDDAEAAELVHRRVGVGDALARHLGAGLDVELLGMALDAGAALDVEGHALVARGRLLWGGCEGVHHLEVEARRLAEVVDDLGIVLGRDIGQLDLDAVRADRADDGLADAEAVDTVADDLDGLGELLIADVLGIGAEGALVDLQGEGDAAFQVETELEPAVGAAEQLVEEEVVALLDVRQRGLELDVREELGEVELLLGTDLLERHVDTGSTPGLNTGGDLAQELSEFGRLG